MAVTNHERVGKALTLFVEGVFPYFERELKAKYGDRWVYAAQEALGEVARGAMTNWDAHAILTVMWSEWNTVFKQKLGRAERSLISELRDARNNWAHQKKFSTDDAYRAIDSVHRFLQAITAKEAEEVDKLKQEILRTRFSEQARTQTRKAASAPIESVTVAGLKPWREVVTPHEDVASGRFQQAEFAADLSQVFKGEGSDEYRNPEEFFRRTFLTDGLTDLLSDALLRLSGKGGNPVVKLQTNFGGGKTHSMIALLHLCSGADPRKLTGIEKVMDRAQVGDLPKANVSVLVGTSEGAASTSKKTDGTVTHTLWGEMAWQLGGKKGYTFVAEADKKGVSPGSEALAELFNACSPCMVLIDEWIAYVRMLYGQDGLPAGSFDANLSFAQALTEAAKKAKNTLVVASIPSSDIEIGGDAGKEALARLEHTFARMESSWRPASAEEGFEIVRRRLFEPHMDDVAKDQVTKAFSKLYKENKQEFPSGCGEGDYERRLRMSYPIHPELFDRLYNDWSSLDRFQRTRGVLRLMATVIHSLWENQDNDLMILPASIPIIDLNVNHELTRYLDDNWAPIIDRDVDGPHSLPLRLDRDNPNLGRYSACRRVARTIYIGSAPTVKTANRGIEDRQIKLGCAQPGRRVPIFGDALRQLTNNAIHLYQDKTRYWYSTQPSVNSLALDRAEQQTDDDVFFEIKRRLRAEQSHKGHFSRVHACPESGADIPDDTDARLVILGPEYPHTSNGAESPAQTYAQEILDYRGTSPRRYKNTLIFLGPEKKRLEELIQGVRNYLAWKSINDEKIELNLDPHQAGQTQTKLEDTDSTVNQRIPEAYVWTLIPSQREATSKLDWNFTKVSGPAPLAEKVSKKLVRDGQLIPQFSGIPLKIELDKLLWRGDDVEIRQLAEDFPQFVYLPRLRSTDTLLEGISEGLGLTSWSTDTFAYADVHDKDKNRYAGLIGGKSKIFSTPQGLLVRPDIAIKQLEQESQETTTPSVSSGSSDGSGTTSDSQPKKKLRRFYGNVRLKLSSVGGDAGRINEEIIQHLSLLEGAKVKVHLEIEADLPDGAPDNVVRTVVENCNALKFENSGFEEE